MRDLQRLANERQLAEERIAREHQAATTAAIDECTRCLADAEATYKTDKTEQEQSHTSRVANLTSGYETQRNDTQAEYRRVRDDIQSKYDKAVRDSKDGKKQAAWQALAVFDASKNNPREALEAVQQQLGSCQNDLDQLSTDAQEILRTRRLWNAERTAANASLDSDDTPEDSPASSKPSTVTDAQAAVTSGLDAVRGRIAHLQDNRLSKMFEGFTPFGLAAAAWLVLLPLFGFSIGWPNWPAWLGASILGAVAVCMVAGLLFRKRLTKWASESYASIARDISAVQGSIELAAIVARDQSRREAQQLIVVRDKELADAEANAAQAQVDNDAWKEAQLSKANQSYPAQLAEMRDAFQNANVAEDEQHHAVMAAITEQHESETSKATTAKQQALEAADRQQKADWESMRDAWFTGFDQLRSSFMEMTAECERLFPDWNHTDYSTWPKPTAPADAIQFGTATLDLTKVKHVVSANPELRPDVREFCLPTLISLHDQPSLVVSAEGEGRAAAIDLLQTLMVRFLTAMPPGKVRFTICDPVNLGESFSSFMHLADHDEGLINGRIWSESRDIDEQLTRLTGHMEIVLQKYLRNEYESIHEYNAQAGEVAEPFQVLAVANFPHGFSDSAARRLLSLAAGGPRCGIYVLLSHDKKQRLPNDFALDDLLAPSVHLDSDSAGQAFVWRYPAFEHLPLQLPGPAESNALVRLVKQAGKLAKESIRVEVPFEVVVPESEDLWRQNCDRELAIPIGRAGANRLQYVRLGKGTAQHMLVAGKTGSGKSTLLHALVTSGALHFSPDELEFYLVDFKKGVEFKSYATHNLPHARVIAIESEREFGLSVLERLDSELRHRGEKFRAAGVQSLGDYRRDHPDEAMPRVLLVVDEFQELFVEDDKLAQEAGLLLDRLVRQGRAFGMHVLLGSQTLSGAYSLARSTLGQMAVRVALQCSESDAHLILSDERNQAARFLSRPGEAIYNDQNGLVAANEPFQVVWLSDRERADHLADINELSKQHKVAKREVIVFEGNSPAAPVENVALMSMLNATTSTEGLEGAGQGGLTEAWLGSAVAIKPPTSVSFAPHGGSNLLVVGQQRTAALGVLTTAAISLAATGASKSGSENASTFLIFDGSRSGDVGEGVWQAVADTIGERAELVSQREVPQAIDRVATELARRDQQEDDSASRLYLVIHNASRFRDLRKSEDDFSFSMDKEKPPAADKQLAEILKNGPQWGIHTLVWCDGYNAVSRLFDRLAMREFEMRVAFQMSAADSSNLLDTPAASQLSQHRALLYNDETGEAEKFRPYGLPTTEWLATVSAALGQGV